MLKLLIKRLYRDLSESVSQKLISLCIMYYSYSLIRFTYHHRQVSIYLVRNSKTQIEARFVRPRQEVRRKGITPQLSIDYRCECDRSFMKIFDLYTIHIIMCIVDSCLHYSRIYIFYDIFMYVQFTPQLYMYRILRILMCI